MTLCRILLVEERLGRYLLVLFTSKRFTITAEYFFFFFLFVSGKVLLLSSSSSSSSPHSLKIILFFLVLCFKSLQIWVVRSRKSSCSFHQHWISHWCDSLTKIQNNKICKSISWRLHTVCRGQSVSKSTFSVFYICNYSSFYNFWARQMLT